MEKYKTKRRYKIKGKYVVQSRNPNQGEKYKHKYVSNHIKYNGLDAPDKRLYCL